MAEKTGDNLALWRSVEKTDPAQTRPYQSGSGNRTTVRPMYLILRATELWGPMGGAWGIRIVTEKIVEGAPITLGTDGRVIGHESIHQVQAEVYYPGGIIPCFGQTKFVGRNQRGTFTDEDAPKKSLTDALKKGLSWLGFSADIHMGMYDDDKYVTDTRQEFAAQKVNGDLREKALAILKVAAKKGQGDLKLAWETVLTKEMRKACAEDIEDLKQEVELLKNVDPR